MRAIASTKTANDSAAHLFARSRSTKENTAVNYPAASSAIPIQRKSSCACGGGCPACQRKLPIQTKLSISEPGDIYEQEADAVADQVMRMPGSVLQDQNKGYSDASASGQRDKDMPQIQHRTNGEGGTGEVASDFTSHLGSGAPLDTASRAYFEPRFGHDFGNVRIRNGPQADTAAASVQARAFTLGRVVVFAAGEHVPGSEGGKRLLAHELTHVVQQSGGGGILEGGERGMHSMVLRAPLAPRQISLKKKGDVEPPLNISVPQPKPGETYQPAVKYPWQNEALRGTIYPYRNEMLSFFLQTYRELELLQDPSQALEVGADEVRAERSSVLARQTAVNDQLKDMRKRKLSKESMAWKQAEQEWTLLRDNLNYLPDPDAKKRKKDTAPVFNQLQRIHWAAYKYARLNDSGQALTHDDRLGKILDRFDADPNSARYPDWLRYMVLHLSGMRYRSAHGSWAPAVALVETLKQDAVKSAAAHMSHGDLAQAAAAADIEGEAEAAQLDKKKDRKRLATLKVRHSAFTAVDSEIEKVFGKPGTPDRDQYIELVRLDGIRSATDEKFKTEKDPKQYQILLDIYDDVLSAASEIEAKLGPNFKKVRAVEEKSRAALIEYELEKAAATLPKDEYGALWVLKKMHEEGSLPDFVWREIVRKTPLKLDEAGADWETVTVAEKESKNRNDETTRRWIEIMKKWAANSTAWREKHREDLSLVPIQAVCDQVAEMSQRVRGAKPTPGIGQKAAWYATPGAATSFGALDSDSQLKPGASLMFIEWSAKEPNEPVHIVRHDKGFALRNEDKETLSDGLVTKGWAYKFLADGRVSRSKKEVIGTSMDPKDPPPSMTVVQWMQWKHEAVVVELDSAHGRILMYETGPIGLRLRTIEKTVGAWNVYIGFAPGGNAPADVKEFLKDIQPGR